MRRRWGWVLLGVGIPAVLGAQTPLPLSLADAVQRGLQHNVTAIVDETRVEAAQGERGQALSEILPHISGNVRQSDQIINTAAFGFSGFGGLPSLIGPFGVFDARLYFSMPLFDFGALNDWRSGRAQQTAAEADYRRTRENVILTVGNLYLEALADVARVASAQSQVSTADALVQVANDRKAAGLVAEVDVLRQQLQLATARARLIQAENELAKRKLDLGRAIGLPATQTIDLTDRETFAPAPPFTVDAATTEALAHRGDLEAARARVDAARAHRQAAVTGAFPSLHFDADVGALGPSASTAQRTFTAAATLRVPIFEGGGTRARVQQANAALRQREAELDDLSSGVRYEVAAALLDIQAAAAGVSVAETAETLAQTELEQTQDRFRAGVASTIELVEAQEAVARAADQHISSIYMHTLAKATLARAMGEVEQRFLDLVGGSKP